MIHQHPLTASQHTAGLTDDGRAQGLASYPEREPKRPSENGQQSLGIRLQSTSRSVEEEEREDDDIRDGKEGVFTVLRKGEQVAGRIGRGDAVGERLHNLARKGNPRNTI